MVGRKKRGREGADERGEVWARIVGQRSNYYISRDYIGEECRTGDEAELELVATIDAISPKQRKHLGEEITISLLAAEKYGGQESRAAPFFGSVNLRGSQRSALAYLPSTPLWALPALIAGRDTWICIGWSHLKRGYGELNSVFVGDAADRNHLLELGGDSLTTQPQREVR